MLRFRVVSAYSIYIRCFVGGALRVAFQCSICGMRLRNSHWVCVKCRRHYGLPDKFTDWPEWAKSLKEQEEARRRQDEPTMVPLEVADREIADLPRRKSPKVSCNYRSIHRRLHTSNFSLLHDYVDGPADHCLLLYYNDTDSPLEAMRNRAKPIRPGYLCEAKSA